MMIFCLNTFKQHTHTQTVFNHHSILCPRAPSVGIKHHLCHPVMFLFCFTLHSLPFILQHFVKCFFMFFLEHIMCFSWFISRTALPPQHTRTQTHTNKIYKESKRLALFTLYRKTPWGDDDCGDMSGWHGLLASACVCARLLSLASRRVLRQDGVSVCARAHTCKHIRDNIFSTQLHSQPVTALADLQSKLSEVRWQNA